MCITLLLLDRFVFIFLLRFFSGYSLAICLVLNLFYMYLFAWMHNFVNLHPYISIIGNRESKWVWIIITVLLVIISICSYSKCLTLICYLWFNQRLYYWQCVSELTEQPLGDEIFLKVDVIFLVCHFILFLGVNLKWD